MIPPAYARILLPILIVAAYAGYHWWRWRMMHPRINLNAMPKPAEEVQIVGEAMKIREAPPIEERIPTPAQSERIEMWQARRERREDAVRLATEAFDPICIALTYRRARANRPECYVRLGEYAWCRGAMVEAHFWVALAKFRGVEGLDEWLGAIRQRWLLLRRPNEMQNVYEQFPPERGALSRAYLLYLSGFNIQLQYDIIMRMAKKGDRDARLILGHIDSQKRSVTYES